MQRHAHGPVRGRFDPAFYRATQPHLANKSAWYLRLHYELRGRYQGRSPSFDPALRECFLQLVPQDRGLLLEIGPFCRPAFVGDHVRYADAKPTEVLKAIAPENGMDPAQCPFIHYVVTETPLESIPERFTSVFSSHCIEHQTDLVGHLQAVDKLLAPGGSLHLVVPDKRYCFDHFRPVSTIADVVTAHVERRTRHDLRTFFTHHALTTHNDAARHWAGDHGTTGLHAQPERLAQWVAGAEAAAGAGEYVDSHAWQFTPESFEEICSLLHAGGYNRLRPKFVYPTPFNRFEFCAVLGRDGESVGDSATASATVP